MDKGFLLLAAIALLVVGGFWMVCMMQIVFKLPGYMDRQEKRSREQLNTLCMMYRYMTDHPGHPPLNP